MECRVDDATILQEVFSNLKKVFLFRTGIVKLKIGATLLSDRGVGLIVITKNELGDSIFKKMNV